MKEALQLTPRQRDRQKRILRATRELLAEQGYEGLQMRVLADRAQVSPMTLYNRFGNKDDLILFALTDLLRDLGERARASGKEGIEFVLHNAEVIADQILETPSYAQAMALMLFNGQPLSPIVTALLHGNLSQAQEDVAAMKARGEIGDEIDADLIARNLSTCGWSTILLWMKGVIPDDRFRLEYVRAPVMVLAPALSQQVRTRYLALLA